MYCCFYHGAIIQSIAPNYSTYLKKKPVPVAARSKAYVCGRWPAETAGSNPTGGMDICCECWVLSGRGLCVGLITRPEESYRLWCVVVCDLETSKMRGTWPTGGCWAATPQEKIRWMKIYLRTSSLRSFCSLLFVPFLNLKYWPQHIVMQQPWVFVCPLGLETRFYTHSNNGWNCSSLCL